MNIRFSNYLDSLTPAKKLIAMEAVKEYIEGDKNDVRQIKDAHDVYTLCRDMALETEEHAVALLLNRRSKLVKRIEVGVGDSVSTIFDCNRILKEMILTNTNCVVMVHNHPSGSIKPSKDDDNLTDYFNKACKTLRFHLIDHVIIANGDFYSYRDNERL